MHGVRVVTGYVPIQGHPRAAVEYGKLGDDLFPKLKATVWPFYETLGECWMWKLVQSSRKPIQHAVADNPTKNSLAYHCVNHQKFAWLLKAAIKDPAPDTFVWIDYGILHVPGVTVDVVNQFLAAIRSNDFAIPGCWPKENTILNDMWPCWRFCGGVMVVPRKYVHKLYKAVKKEVRRKILDAGCVTWEVNTLAAIEATIPVRWYQADHNETMFSNYGADL